MSSAAVPLPVVLLPIGTDDAALDGCLAALDTATPAGTQVWLADNAQIGPRGQALIERWLTHTQLKADYSRRPQPLSEVAHLDEMLSACAGMDVVVLAADAQPLPGWLTQLSACLASDASIATATPWCNAGEAAAWPLLGQVQPLPADPKLTAHACAAMASTYPELPAAVSHAVALRGRAHARAGGLDLHSYQTWYAALIDLSMRMSGLGWRNVLCETAFVARSGEGGPADGDLDTLATRWPDWNARLARFLMDDPLRETRARLDAHHTRLGTELQRELFG